MTYRFLDFEVDKPTRELRRGDRVIAVEAQVFDLLVFLIERRERIVSKDEIFEHVWMRRFVTDAALSTRIRDVRAALDDSGKSQNIIRTVRGRGFRFVADIESEDVAVADEKPPPVRDRAVVQEVRFFRSFDGTRIAFSEIGEGDLPIVKTANWMSHLEYEFESPVWRHWIDSLSRMSRLIRYDERGNGLSQRDLLDVSHEDCVRDLETLIKKLGLERLNLFGISQGASVAIDFAAKHPAKVNKIVIYGGFARGWRFNRDERVIGQRIAMSMLMENGWGQDSPEFRQLFTSRFMPEATADQARWFNDLQRKSVAPKMAAKLHNMFGSIDVLQALGKVRAPTLVLHARGDAEIPISSGREIAEGIDGARFVSIDSQNHILLENEPAFSELVTTVERFLRD